MKAPRGHETSASSAADCLTYDIPIVPVEHALLHACLSLIFRRSSHDTSTEIVVYIRQSTPQQVAENRESTDRQYALVNRAIELGWSPERILVIDEDQGKSGTTAENRLGFQRLLAEISLDHVGLILGLEMSRLARSCKDWHQLLELCFVSVSVGGPRRTLRPDRPDRRARSGSLGSCPKQRSMSFADGCAKCCQQGSAWRGLFGLSGRLRSFAKWRVRT